jgi:serine/threonine protein kinase
LSLVVVKIILKSALTGLAVLHNQGIVHTGIYPAVYLQFARDDSLLFVDI